MIPMKEIERFCANIAEAFRPRRIILFGSYARGTATEDSDVDVLVVMPKSRYRRDLGWRIPLSVNPSFPVDVLVHHDEQIARRLAAKESFMLDVTEEGKVMYEADNRGVAPKG